VTSIAPGWYKDPAEPTTQRYWDGDGWVGAPIPADAVPPAGPPPLESSDFPGPGISDPAPAVVAAPAGTATDPATPPPAVPAGWQLNRTTSPTAPGGPGGPVTMPPVYGFPAQFAAAAPRPHGLALATLGSRFAARIVDVLAVAVLCAIANAWFAVQFWHNFSPFSTEFARRVMNGDNSTEGMPVIPESTGTLLIMMCVATTLVWFAYEVPGTANTGQTLGKRLMHIKVVRMESGEPLGFGRAFRRWSRLGLPTLLWYCCFIGLLLQFIDCLFATIDRPLHQALHDKSAGTVVVAVPGPAQQPGGSRADSTRP
jgi:uncharacterized RDD family membrane protein YckC